MKQFIVTILTFLTGFVNAQFAGHIDPSIGFANNYAMWEGRDIKKLTNGNIVVCGKQFSSATQSDRGNVMELNSNGGFISQQINTNTATFFACDTIDANNFIAVGKHVNQGNHIVFLRKNLSAYTSVDVDLSSVFTYYVDVYDLITQPDGKFVICGVSSTNGLVNKFWIARFNNNLSIDNTFGTNGHVSLAFGNDAQARALALQADGKIVAVGHSITNKQTVTVRLNSNGTLDNSFFNVGYTLSQSETNYSELYGVAVASNNTIYSVGVRKGAGNAQGQIKIITPSQNNLIYTLSTNAKWYSVSLQSDSSKLIISGQSGPDGTGRTVPIVYRFRMDGTGAYVVDNSFNGFGNFGLYTTGISGGVNQDLTMSNYIQSDGKILLSGKFNGTMFVTRLENDYVQTGVNELNTDNSLLTFYPNPSNGVFNLNKDIAFETLKVFDVFGKEVEFIPCSENTFKINSKGVYLVQVKTVQNKIITKRVIIQ